MHSYPPPRASLSIPILHRFLSPVLSHTHPQNLVELQESATMLLDAASCQRRATVPDLRATFAAWRERVPNKWEELPVWSRLFTWRSHMFGAVTAVFNLPEQSPQLAQVCAALSPHFFWWRQNICRGEN